MRQLTSLDAQFLAIESPRQTGHVSMLVVLDPGTESQLTLQDARDLVKSRLHLLRPFRWRLQTVPFGLDNPFWIDDLDFDLDYHLRELALPAPGNDEQLGEQVSRLAARRLDRSRPLWELYLIHGLSGGRLALLTKIHHAAVDGVSGVELLSVLLDAQPEPAPSEPPPDRPPHVPPSDLEMLGRGLIGTPRYLGRLVRASRSTLPNLADAPLLNTIPGVKALGRTTTRLFRAARREPGLLQETDLTAPRTPFNQRMSGHRRLALGRLSLKDAKAAKDLHGSTLNDVVVSVCAGAVRSWLIAHDALPDTPLVVQVPVSVRTAEQMGTYGNRVGVMTVPFHTDEPDPVARLRLTHEALRAAKEKHQALPATMLQDATEFIHPAVAAQAMRATLSLAMARAPIWNMVVSNVPGPREPLYFCGARVEAIYPVSMISDGVGLNITVFSYCDSIDVGIVVDREQVPDVWRLVDWMQDSLNELLALDPGSDA